MTAAKSWHSETSARPGWRPICATSGLGLVLAFLVLRYGGVVAADWNIGACGIALIAAFVTIFPGPTKFATPAPAIFWPMILLCAYVGFQTVPLPMGAVASLSPARFQLNDAVRVLGDVPRFATLSVVPSLTLGLLSTFLGYALILVITQNVARQARNAYWLLILPLVLVAAAESVIGLLQAGLLQTAGTATTHLAHGTYVNKNHFAGFLEMILAFPLAYGFSQWQLSNRIRSAIAFTLTGLIAAAIVVSTSRSGIVAALVAVLVALAVLTKKRPLFLAAVAGAGVAVVAATLIAFPIEGIDAIRPAIWKDTLKLIRAYPLTGCGLGTFEMALFPYKTAAPLYTVDYAHNDYLQFLGELGAIGFLLLAATVAAVVGKVIGTARNARTIGHRALEHRALLGASLGAFAAMALHSFTDFNLYIPANAVTLAWIAGVVLGAKVPDTEVGRP